MIPSLANDSFKNSRLLHSLRLNADPTYLMEQAGIKPDPWQKESLRSFHKRMMFLCSRQTGKSTTASAIALHRAITRPNSLVLLLSPSLRQSQELFRKVLNYYNESGRPVDPELESSLRLILKNNSRILSLPGKEATIRGYSGAALIIIDEASRVSDDLYYSIRPMLAVGAGRLVVLSTPFGKRGWFHKAWTEEEDWHKITVTAHDCPRISQEFLDRERRELGDRWFKQEYECSFEDTIDSVFTHETISRMFNSDGIDWGNV